MPTVEATFVMEGLNRWRSPDHYRIEEAMIEAVRKAQAEGVTDPDIIRQRILEARDLAQES